MSYLYAVVKADLFYLEDTFGGLALAGVLREMLMSASISKKRVILLDISISMALCNLECR